jgi:hypothetical protein
MHIILDALIRERHITGNIAIIVNIIITAIITIDDNGILLFMLFMTCFREQCCNLVED